MRGLKPWLVIALVFLAGIAVGVLGTRAVVRRFADRAMRDPKFAGEKVESIRNRMEQELVSGLDLTPEQQTNVHAIFVDSGEQLRKLHSEFEPRMRQIFDDAHQKIAATLTPEQREKYEKLMKERRERFEKFRDKGFGPPHRGDHQQPPHDKP